MLIVTCAIIIQHGKILICQRSDTMDLPLKWEFPGGKVEPGEDDGRTIVREIKEELHVDTEVAERWEPVEYTYPTCPIKLVPFVARVAGGELRREEHVAARRVAVDELGQYDWAPADIPIVEKVINDTPH